MQLTHSRSFTLIFILFLLFIPTGCSVVYKYVPPEYVPKQFKPTLKATQSKRYISDENILPKYRVGTKFVYSNGTWEKVIGVDGDTITWLNHRGYKSTSSSDFTYRDAEYETSKSVGRREFEQTNYLFEEPTVSLWPLWEGNETRFEEFITRIKKETGNTKYIDNYWRCGVIGKSEKTVLAGTFDTWEITCKRYTSRKNFPKYLPREYKTWHYSPEVQHWVSEKRSFRGGHPSRKKELVAVLPDVEIVSGGDEVVAGRIRDQFQNTLESKPSGHKATWASNNGLVVSTVPKKVFKHPSGLYCRQYSQEFMVAGKASNFYGMACRSDDGVWHIPRR